MAKLVLCSCSLLLLSGAAACSTEPDRADQSRVACAIGSADFASDCTVEQAATPEGTVLTIRHPDGGFRRLVTTRDGRGVVPADGAEGASVKLIGNGQIEVQVGNARYRLPATMKGAK